MRRIVLAILFAVGIHGQTWPVWTGLLAAGEDGKSAKLPAEVFKHWKHSREEDAGGVRVFRPAGYKFPLSRGRAGFDIKKNGDFVDYPIAATDGNEKVPGTWKLDEAGKVVVTFQDPGRPPLVIQIVECDGNVLKLK